MRFQREVFLRQIRWTFMQERILEIPSVRKVVEGTPYLNYLG